MAINSPLYNRGVFGGWVSELPGTPRKRLVMDTSGNVSAESDTPSKLLITAFGESNSGGAASNSDATADELAARSSVQMWNVLTEVFEDLDIGTNNNLDHLALTSATHGWELGLANRVEQGYFRECDVYYLQTGQGGSSVSGWIEGGTYWTKFRARTAGAKAALGAGVQHVVWIAIGINDALGGTPAASYKSVMLDIIARIKVELPGCKIFYCKLMPYEDNPTYTAAYGDYNTAIQEIADSDSDVTAVSVTDPLLPFAFPHWGYVGMKSLAGRLVEATARSFDFPRAVDELIETYAAPLYKPSLTGQVTIVGENEDNATCYGVHATGGSGANSYSIGGYFSAGSGGVNIAIQTGTGNIDFNGTLDMNGNIITDAGNVALGGVYTAAAGNLKVQDRTSGYAAGQGGGILFTGDTYAQGNQDAGAFARIRGVKENGTYANGLGKLVLGTQTSTAITPDGSTITDWLEISSSGAVALINGGGLKPAIKTIATLPSAAAYEGQRFRVSDSAVTGGRQVYSDGSAWYYENGAAV